MDADGMKYNDMYLVHEVFKLKNSGRFWAVFPALPDAFSRLICHLCFPAKIQLQASKRCDNGNLRVSES